MPEKVLGREELVKVFTLMQDRVRKSKITIMKKTSLNTLTKVSILPRNYYLLWIIGRCYTNGKI
jgi:hypothetical protein